MPKDIINHKKLKEMEQHINKKTKITRSSSYNVKYYSLRTTIPNPIAVMLNLKAGDYLVWNAEYDIGTDSPKITIEKATNKK